MAMIMTGASTYVVGASDDVPPHASCLVSALSKGTGLQTRIRPRMQFSILSPSSLFRIHYDTLGLNAVPSADNDSNGIPDFVDSAAFYMDAAYRFCIDTLGYRPPPRDYVDSSAWDVYLVQLGRVPGFYFNDRDLGQFGWYGATYGEDLIPLRCGGYASNGFIFLDNDYSSQDSIGTAVKRATYSDTGIAALKITCYHEFHHLVQYGYFYGASPTFYEMTSVWIEQRAFPTVTNYTQYVRRLFANPTLYCLSCDRSIEGSYGYSIALRYLALQLGDNVIRAWWEGIGQCSLPPIALDSVVAHHGQSFSDLWCRMLPWLYWTGSRAQAGYFPDAAILPELKPDNSPEDQRFIDPSWIRTISLYPLQFKLLRAVLPSDNPQTTADTADFIVTNPLIRQLATDPRQSIDYNVSIHRSPNGARLGNTPYYYTHISNLTCDMVVSRSGFVTTIEDNPTPQPLIRSRHTELILPVPTAAHAGDLARLSFHTSEGIEVYHTTVPVEVGAANRRRARIATTDPNFPRQGVYLVIVQVEGQSILTKVAIMP